MKSKNELNKILFFNRPGNRKVIFWRRKIENWLKHKYPQTQFIKNNKVINNDIEAPNLIIALGGDGTILEAARKYYKWNPVIFGLNLGHLGFIASVQNERDFLKSLELLMQGKYKAEPRLMISSVIKRKDRTIAKLNAINEIAIQHLMGMVELKVEIENHPLQFINGSGVLIATASGSTAYNLSAHGPIVIPSIRCFVITEILDHNIPTPSIIISNNQTIAVTIENFRKQDKFILSQSNKKADVILTADGSEMIPLQIKDKIIIKESKYQIRFAEIDKNHFFKSLQEKFAFK